MIKRNCILIVSDQEYLRYSVPLLASIKSVVDLTNTDVHVELINVSESLSSQFPFANFVNESIELDIVKTKKTLYKEMPLLNGELISNKQAYCNNKRYEIIPQLLAAGYENILYVDADHIIRKDISKLFEIISFNDITIHKYPLDRHPLIWRHFMTYCCGMIGVHNTPSTVNFFSNLQTEIVSHGIFEIGDQKDFISILKRANPKIKLGQIPQEFKDDEFSEESYIWTGDGNRKFMEKFVSKLVC